MGRIIDDNVVYCLLIAASILEILRSKSKVVVNRTDFRLFFAFPNFKGAVPPNVASGLSPLPSGTSSRKV